MQKPSVFVFLTNARNRATKWESEASFYLAAPAAEAGGAAYLSHHAVVVVIVIIIVDSTRPPFTPKQVDLLLQFSPNTITNLVTQGI